MNSKYVLILGLSTLLFLSAGCACIFPDIKIRQAERKGALHLNMTFDEVKKLVGREAYLGEIVRSINFQGEMIIWTLDPGLNWSTTYSFTFLNNRLISWMAL